MADQDRQCYLVDVDNYAYGPFRSEMAASMSSFSGRIEWLEPEFINEYGKVCYN